MANFAAAMKDSTLRFFAVEHLSGMLLAVVIAQVGYSISKRAVTDRGKFLTVSRRLLDCGCADSCERSLALHEIWPSTFPILRWLIGLKIDGLALHFGSSGRISL